MTLPPDGPSTTAFRARKALFKRLADVVCLPSSRVNAFERSVTADLLVDMLREAMPEERLQVAKRLANLSEIPASLVRVLLRDQIDIASPLLTEANSLTDSDLLDCARHAGLEHRRLIAMRRGVSEVVCEELIRFEELPVIEALLRNDLARFSNSALEAIVAATRGESRLVSGLLRRTEMRPSHAYVLFWWADAEARRTILQRFAVSREVMQEAAGDVFAMASDECWQDPLVRKALQFIERRQRNRAALDRSPFESLEQAITVGEQAMTREVADEIAYLSGLKPMTGAKIFTDTGGEALAILCKAVGLSRQFLASLWKALRRTATVGPQGDDPGLERVIEVFDMMSVDRAQTVLRYWNWSLSSALTPALLQAIRHGDEFAPDEYSVPQRAAMLALSR